MILQELFLFLTILSISFGELSSTSSYARKLKTTSNSKYSCDSAGYNEYLSNWTEMEKSSSRDSSSEEYKERLQYFIDNCKMINEWNKKDKYKMEFTYYVDWSAEEFNVFGSTSQSYSGIQPIISEIQVSFNNTNHRYLLPSIDPCDDVLKEGENSIIFTIK